MKDSNTHTIFRGAIGGEGLLARDHGIRNIGQRNTAELH